VTVSCLAKRTREPIGGSWSIVWVDSAIPESGGHHPYLFRETALGNRRVEENTWRYRYLGDDCVLYVAGNSDRGELMAACGGETPVVVTDHMDDKIEGYTGDKGLTGDPIVVNGTPLTIASIKQKARGHH
jgi:hypothetical protein